MSADPSFTSAESLRGAAAQPAANERRRQPESPSGAFAGIKAVGISSIQDTLSCRRHSKDFAYARGDYLRSRVLVVGLIFAILTPLWVIMDIAVLPAATLAYTTPGRFFLMAGLLATIWLARCSRARIGRIRISAGLLIALPASFYALVLITLPAGAIDSLVGYSFIPFLLVATLSIFPFTLAESAASGLALLLLHIFSQYVSGSWMTPAGWEDIWLLSALFVVALTANYFHLVLLLRLYREATHDPLTGLLNRGALAHNLQQLATVRPRVPMTLLMLDMDHFKRINDAHGHSVGDQVLRKFASILRQQVRKADFVSRYGGEEFVAVLVGTQKADAAIVAERIRQQAESTHVYNHEGVPVPFTVSIGVASFHDDEPLDDVARRADDRLYEAKKRQRNCVVSA
ncbi:MAG TPA: diguanylate cyclase [Candidimonas sp.]|nr:diguanylate cyclase [Candidimonas sp.]